MLDWFFMNCEQRNLRVVCTPIHLPIICFKSPLVLGEYNNRYECSWKLSEPKVKNPNIITSTNPPNPPKTTVALFLQLQCKTWTHWLLFGNSQDPIFIVWEAQQEPAHRSVCCFALKGLFSNLDSDLEHLFRISWEISFRAIATLLNSLN